MPRINSLKIRKLGNVAPGTELKFGPRGAVLLGRNGTGKTTLLDTLASICKLDLQSLPGDYDLEFSLISANDVELRVTAKCETAATSASAGPTKDPVAAAMRSVLQERARRHTLGIEVLHPESGKRTVIESNDNETTCVLPDGDRVVDSIPASQGWRVLVLGSATGAGLTPLWPSILEFISLDNTLRRFDEGLDYFRDLTERGPNAAHIESAEGGKSVNIVTTRLISQSCARLLLTSFNSPGNESNSGFGYSADVKYLKRFCDLTGFTQARIGADLDEKHQLDGEEVIELSPLRFEVQRNGSILHHRHLSFGQRRLLAFLHYHDSTPTLVMADELVNGMHHEWISQCVDVMRDAQAFLSSQNPLLFDFLTFESAEDVASRFVICDLDEQHRFVWRNMSEPDALEFYETHKAGLQHASSSTINNWWRLSRSSSDDGLQQS